MNTSTPHKSLLETAGFPAASPTAASAASNQPGRSLTSEQFIELEGGVIDLMCQMEFLLSEVKESDPADRNEMLVETSQKMLSGMADFAEAFLEGDSLEKVNQEISTTFMSSQVLKELTQSLSIGGLLRRTFGAKDPNQDAIDENTNELIRTLKRTFVTVLFHTIQLAGFDSPMGKQFDQSTCVFVTELESFKVG
jgi:hypothetical protein